MPLIAIARKSRFEPGRTRQRVPSEETLTLPTLLAAGDADHLFGLHRTLPRERILIEADLFTPPAPNTPPPATASAAAMSLFNNVQRLKLPVNRIAPLHGRVIPWNEFLQLVGKAGTQ